MSYKGLSAFWDRDKELQDEYDADAAEVAAIGKARAAAIALGKQNLVRHIRQTSLLPPK